MPDAKLTAAPHAGQTAALWDELCHLKRRLLVVELERDELAALLRRLADACRVTGQRLLEEAALAAAGLHRGAAAARELRGEGQAPVPPPEAVAGQPGAAEGEVLEGDAT